MRKAFALLTASLMLMSCAQKTKNVQELSTATAGTDDQTTITWIEDKPGPTLQGHNIFPTVPDSLWDALGLQEGVPSSMSCILLETEGEKILIDAGLGAAFSQLTQTLESHGITSSNLKLIYITHMHGDHIGGLLKDGQAAFPNAELYINRVEAEAWQSMAPEKNQQQTQVLEAYKNHLHLFEAGDVLPGQVETIAAYGHTPGHTLFQKGRFLVIADLMHGAALQLEHPEYCPFFDMDPAAATESRLRILEYARQNNLTMYGMHLPAPGYLE